VFQFRIQTLLIVTAVVAVILVCYMLWTGPTLNERLQVAAEAGQKRHFEWLIWLGADVDDGRGEHSYGGTPMIWAAHDGHLEAVKMYVENGAYLDHTEKDMFTAGTLAADAGHWDVVAYLVDQGANYRIPNATGRSIVGYAVEAGREDILAQIRRQPTPLSRWRIEQKDCPERMRDGEIFNRTIHIMFRMPDSSEETEVTWFRAYVKRENGRETVVTGPLSFEFAPDGNSLVVTYANGSVETRCL